MEKEKPASSPEPDVDRPYMPPDYGLDRNSEEGMVPWSYVEEQLEKAHNYWVGTTRADGKPHAMPVWGVWMGNAFYFSTDRESRKGRNLAANPQVVVHLESGAEVVIVEGKAEEVTNPELRALMSATYTAKYNGIPPEPHPGAKGVVIYGVKPEVIMAWREAEFPNSASRWRFK